MKITSSRITTLLTIGENLNIEFKRAGDGPKADTFESGVRNLYKYVRIYSGALPIFDEGDIFRLTVPLNAEHSPEGGNDPRTEGPDRKPGQKVRTKNPDRKPKIELVEQLLQLIQTTPKITQNEMIRLLGIARSTLNVHIDALKKSNRLRRVGPDKGGHWEVVGRPRYR